MSVTVNPNYRWHSTGDDLLTGLALGASPDAEVDAGTIGLRELIPADVQAIATGLTVAPHETYTVPGDIAVAALADVLVVTQVISGALTTQLVGLNQQDPLLFYYGTVTSADHVTLRVRNLSAATAGTVPSGRVLRYLLL